MTEWKKANINFDDDFHIEGYRSFVKNYYTGVDCYLEYNNLIQNNIGVMLYIFSYTGRLFDKKEVTSKKLKSKDGNLTIRIIFTTPAYDLYTSFSYFGISGKHIYYEYMLDSRDYLEVDNSKNDNEDWRPYGFDN